MVFNHEKKELAACKMEYVWDEYGREVLLKDGRFQVMMEWEKPYMEACIDALQPSGDVLEIGFGCGYSATRIQEYQPRSHTIIEYHPVVVERARKWAENYPNVKIIEDTWQNALEYLGLFDEIFFDDYPLESADEQSALQKEQQEAHQILALGRARMQEVEKQLSFLQHMKYSDDDIETFFSLLKKESPMSPEGYLRFFYDLEKKGNINNKQLDHVLKRLITEGLIKGQDVVRYDAQQKAVPVSSILSTRSDGDRLFTFLDRCLKKHMRLGSKFSCYLNDPTSKYEDKKFFDLVITNPFLDYIERRIAIDIPPNCQYYKGTQALVIIITKLGD